MKLFIAKGKTSKSLLIFIPDSSSTVGAGLTGLAYNSSGLTWYYYREGQGTGGTAVTLATMTLGTWATGGFVEVDATNLPGWYEIGVPNAALASGVDFVGMQLKGATNMAPVNIEIQLSNLDVNDGVRAGLTALPNAAADAPFGLPISDAGGLDLDALNTAAVRLTAARAQVLDDWVNAGRLDLLLDAIKAVTDAIPNGGAMTSIATAAALATVDSNVDAVLVDTGATLPATLSTIAGYIDTEVAAIKAVTDLLPDAGALTSLATASALAVVDGNVDAIKVITDALTAAAAAKLALNMAACASGTATGGTTASVTSGLTGEGDDTFNGRVLIFTSGSLKYEAGVITGYTSATGAFTFAASTFTTSPTSETFVIL